MIRLLRGEIAGYSLLGNGRIPFWGERLRDFVSYGSGWIPFWGETAELVVFSWHPPIHSIQSHLFTKFFGKGCGEELFGIKRFFPATEQHDPSDQNTSVRHKAVHSDRPYAPHPDL